MTVPIPQTSSVAPGDPPVPAAAKHERLASLDAYRGAIMLLMASGGLGLSRIAQEFPDSALWQTIAHHTEHARWAGFTLWDIIQPAFMFMVGVACPFQSPTAAPAASIFSECSPTPFGAPSRSYSSPSSSPPHRAAVPFGSLPTSSPRSASATPPSSCSPSPARAPSGLPLFLSSWCVGSPSSSTRCQPLTSIGNPRASPATGLDWRVSPPTGKRTQTLPPPSTAGFSISSREKNPTPSLTAATQPSTSSPPSPPWSLASLPANCSEVPVPSSARSSASLPSASPASSSVGPSRWPDSAPWSNVSGPPSWTICSAGWAALILAAFVTAIDAGRLKRLAFPLIIVGVNPIALYCMWQLMGPFIKTNLKRHVTPDLFDIFGPAYAPLLERAFVLIILWLIILWMYRRKIFLRI